MRAEKEQAPLLSSKDMVLAHDICSLMHEADVAIAVFDSQFRLLSSNPAHQTMLGLPDGVAVVGVTIQEIGAYALKAAGFDSPEIGALLRQETERLRKIGKDRIQTVNARSEKIRITRHTKPSGLVVETIHQSAREHVKATPGSGEEFNLLTEAAKRLDASLEHVPNGFMMFDAEGRLTALNERARELQPHIYDDLKIGNTYGEITLAAYRSGELERLGQSEEEFLTDALKRFESFSSQKVGQIDDGRWIRTAHGTLYDGSVIFTVSDASEIKAQQRMLQEFDEALARQTTLLDYAIENMFAGFVMFDKDNRMITCNSTYLDMFGFSEAFACPGVRRQELMDRAIEKGTFAPGYDTSAQAVVDDSDGSIRPALNKYHLTDGRILQTRYTPIPGEGAQLLFLDITSEEQAKKQLIKNNRKLESSNEELQNFAYVASHDLQEPLRKIEAFGDRLLKKYGNQLPEDGQLYMNRIQNAAERMRQLINDLLSFSRVTSQAKAFEPVDLNEVLDGVRSDIQIRLEETNGMVTAEQLPTIQADPLQMRQLFQNLISNSLKFAKDGVSPVIAISSTVRPPKNGAGSFLELKFEDNGIGFDNRFKDQIFTIFQRLHGRQAYEGTGIGLATCRKIVERHNGFMDADGTEGKCAIFSVDLPLEQSEIEE